MKQEIVIRIQRRHLIAAAAVALVAVIMTLCQLPLFAQKVQEAYKDKFKLAGPTGNVTVATSADGYTTRPEVSDHPALLVELHRRSAAS